MAKNMKRKSKLPRHKRMKREARLQSAKHWIPKYEGKNIVRGYSKHYNVNKLCAIKELKILNIEIDEDYMKNLKRSLEAQKKARQERKRRKEEKKN